MKERKFVLIQDLETIKASTVFGRASNENGGIENVCITMGIGKNYSVNIVIPIKDIESECPEMFIELKQ